MRGNSALVCERRAEVVMLSEVGALKDDAW
jgi:hypothetical protein